MEELTERWGLTEPTAGEISRTITNLRQSESTEGWAQNLVENYRYFQVRFVGINGMPIFSSLNFCVGVRNGGEAHISDST